MTSIQFNGATCCAHNILRMGQAAQANAVIFVSATDETPETVDFLLPGNQSVLTLRVGQFLHLNGNTLIVSNKAEI